MIIVPLIVSGLLAAPSIPPGEAIRWQAATNPAPGAKGALALPDGRILIPGHARREGTAAVDCHITADGGRSWTRLGAIATDADLQTDLGDGNIVRLRDGRLLATYRRNHYGGESGNTPDYAIEVAESRDGGRSWRRHSTVENSRPGAARPSRGLWAPFLFVTSRGEVQCYYDDENTPWLKGFPGHQWLMMRPLHSRSGRWGRAVTVSRAPDPKHLSRDGMAAVAQLRDGTLLCALESVQTAPPHAGVLRVVTSRDGGRTWSWSRGQRPVLYEPRDIRYHAFSPWLLRLPSGTLVCAFATNEDRPEPGISGTPPDRLRLDIKTTVSHDGGKHWSKSHPLYTGTHRNYLPSLVLLPNRAKGRARVLATFLDFDKGSLSVLGEVDEIGSRTRLGL